MIYLIPLPIPADDPRWVLIKDPPYQLKCPSWIRTITDVVTEEHIAVNPLLFTIT
jgi:hypothetical protein